MLRDSTILYELCTQLKEHRYINHDSDEILTDSQEQRINDYIDDLSIDLFFRLASFKPILITPNDTERIYTPFGLKELKGDYALNLNSVYDRYTFVSILTHPDFLKNKFKNNKFIINLSFDIKRFSATGTSFTIKNGVCNNPYVYEFKKQYKFSLDWNRSATLCGLGDFISNSDYKCNLEMDSYFASLLSDYSRIKHSKIFPGITLEYALSLYIILVEKLKLKEENISSVFAHGYKYSDFDPTNPLVLFHNFELRLDKLFRKNEIELNDVFLRFVKPETSKAFKIDFDIPSQNFVTIQLFNNKSIKDVWFYNTLPLPYLNSKKQNK